MTKVGEPTDMPTNGWLCSSVFVRVGVGFALLRLRVGEHEWLEDTSVCGMVAR